MKKIKIIIVSLLAFLLCVPTVYKLNISTDNEIIIIRGILVDTIKVILSISSIDIVNGISLLLSLMSISLFVTVCCSKKHFIKSCIATLISTGLSIILGIIFTLQLHAYMTVLGIIANIVPILIYLSTLIFFIVYVIKFSYPRPSKTARPEARVDELQKQVDELKKED